MSLENRDCNKILFHQSPFLNAECTISLQKWNISDVLFTKFKTFEIIIDLNDKNKLYTLIQEIVKQNPYSIEIIPEGNLFNHLLDDQHVALLKGICIVGIPKNYNITICGLRYLLLSEQICISECMGIKSDSFALESYSLKYIQTWGWGSNHNFTKDIEMFINKINNDV